jgi:hypothetical protein
MRWKSEPLHDRRQTGRRMYALAALHGDLSSLYIRDNCRPVPLSKLPLPRFYNMVRNIPYRRDDNPVEVVARPRYIIERASGGADCKKKAILLGAWFNANGFRPGKDWRFVAMSSKQNGSIHHVFPQVNMSGTWKNADATYRYMRLLQPKKVTAYEVLTP